MTNSEPNQMLLSETIDNNIMRFTMNNLENRNALSASMMSHLIEAITLASVDKDTRVIVLAANGTVFSAGHDLKEITEARNADDEGEAYYRKLFNTCSSLMQLIVHCPKPVIAEISGTATAAGCQLVASCDLAIASNEAKFATPGVNIGLFCSTPMVALSRNVANKHAMEMLLTGDLIHADKAKEIGLINNHVDNNLLREEVNNLAKKIASKSAMTLKIGKKAFYEQSKLDLEQAYQFTSEVMLDNMLKDDAKEGINAFIEKRDPEWKDK